NDGSPNRIQQNFFDLRDRLVASKDGVQGNSASENNGTHRPIYYLSYDNLNEVTAAQHYEATATHWQARPACQSNPPAIRRYSRLLRLTSSAPRPTLSSTTNSDFIRPMSLTSIKPTARWLPRRRSETHQTDEKTGERAGSASVYSVLCVAV